MRFRLTIPLVSLIGWLAVGACTEGSSVAPEGPDGTDGTVISLSVTPSRDTIIVGGSVRLTARASMSNNASAPPIMWRSTSPNVADVIDGMVHGAAPGTTRVVAEAGNVADTADIWVETPPPVAVASVAVTPAAASALVGTSVQLTATPKDANGNPLTGRTIAWSTSAPSVATVDGNGLVTAVAAGSASITATSEGRSASSALTVTTVAAAVATVSVSPATATLEIGRTVQLTATPRDASGNALSGHAVGWASSNTAAATVNGSGLVTGVGAGSATITATSEGKSGASTITVPNPPAPVASVQVTPASASMVIGQTVQLTATPKDANGTSLGGRTVTWASNNTSVATVASDGRVSALAAGTATITATSEGRNGSATITVQAPPPPPTGTTTGIWISADEIRLLPTSGAAWDNVKRAADSDLSGGVLSTRDEHNVNTMAAGLVALRLNSDVYRARVRESLRGLIAAPIDGGDPLAIVRRLGTYAIAADLIDLKTFDPTFDAQFRAWLDRTRKTEFGGETVAAIHERRPNNWGTHAGISRIATALYLGDRVELERAAKVYKGWLGDRTSYASFSYSDVAWWQADPTKPVGINPKGAMRDGHSIDGVLPDDQRRAGGFVWPPQKENYVYTALEGALGEAVLLSRQNYDVWNWSDRALLRAFVWLHEQANYPAEGNDGWQPYIINKVYGTSFPVPSSSSPGKNIGWADWTHR